MRDSSPTDPPIEAVVLRWPTEDTVQGPGGREGDGVWRAIVASILQQGEVEQSELDKVWPLFFTKWPSHSWCMCAGEHGSPTADEMIELLDGIAGRRQKVGIIRRLSRVWDQRHPPQARVMSMPGCKNREDQVWRVFGEHFFEPNPEVFTDPILAAWLELRAREGWDYLDETEVVKEALGHRLSIDSWVEVPTS